MGIIFHGKGLHNATFHSQSYKNRTPCAPSISRQRASKALTRQNIQFLKSLGLRIAFGGK